MFAFIILLIAIPYASFAESICRATGEIMYRSAGPRNTHFETVPEACLDADFGFITHTYLGYTPEEIYNGITYHCKFLVRETGTDNYYLEIRNAYGDCVQTDGSWVYGFCEPTTCLTCPGDSGSAGSTAGGSSSANPGMFSAGNPIEIASGQKTQRETDWISAKDSRFSIARTYSSARVYRTNDDEFGSGWVADWATKMILRKNKRAQVYFPGEGKVAFGSYATNFAPLSDDPTSKFTLTYTGEYRRSRNRYGWNPEPTWENDQFELRDGSGRVVTLSVFGFPESYQYGHYVKWRYPTKVRWPDGYEVNYTRDGDGLIQTASDSLGQLAQYTWAVPGEYHNASTISQIEIDTAYDGTTFAPDIRIAYTYVEATGEEHSAAIANVVVTEIATTQMLKNTSYTYVPDSMTQLSAPLLASIKDGRVDQGSQEFNYAEFEYTDYQGSGLVASDPVTGYVKATATQHADGTQLFTVLKDTTQGLITEKVKVTNPLGKETEYSYNWIAGYKKPTQIEGIATQSCLGTSMSLGYTPNPGAPAGYIYERVERNGSRTVFERDSRGLVTKITEDADGVSPRVTTFSWHNELRKPLSRSTSNLKETFGYDVEGQLVSYSQTDVLGGSPTYGQVREWSYSYATLPNGLKVLASVDGPGLAGEGVSDVTAYTYNSDGTLATSTDPNGLVTTYASYDEFGNASRIVEPNGVTWALTYNGRNEVVRIVEDPDGNSPIENSFAYDIVGQLVGFTNSSGHTWSFEYDKARRLIGTRDSQLNAIAYSHDAAGNITRTEYRDANGTVRYFEESLFDELARLKTLVGAMGQSTSFTYDVEDNLVQTIDGLGNVTANGFDALNRVISITDTQNSAQSTMAHNDADQATQYVDPRSIATTYSYNGFGEVVEEVSADRGITTYTYNRRGLVTSLTDARGVISNYAYDDGGRLIARTFPSESAQDQAFTYDGTGNSSQGLGQIATITDAAGAISREYGQGGRLTLDRRQLHMASYDIGYSYNADGLLASVETPSKLRINYTYDSQQRIVGLSVQRRIIDPATGQYPPVQTVLSNAHYLPFGPLSGFTYGDGAQHSRSFDNSYRLTDQTDTLGSVALRDVGYSWTNRDNLAATTNRLDLSGSESFGYSAQGRLTQATGNYGTIDYDYDLVGNRILRNIDTNGAQVVEQYTFPAASNRLSSIATGQNTRSFSYDPAGNVTYDNRTGGEYGYTYDAAGRMSAFLINGVVQSEYLYNALGQQAIRRLSQEGRTLHVLHDAEGNRLAEYDYDPATGTSTLLREYIWLGMEAVGVVENDTLYLVRADHIGRPVLATDSTGAVVWQASYLPFGEVSVSTGSAIELRFPGQWYQAETGLHQNWMRDYDPTTGRYIQADPLGLVDGASVYGYALQNPGRYTDPTGEVIPAAILGGMAVGFGLGLLEELWRNEWQFRCVNWNVVGFSTAFGAAGGAFGWGLKNGLGNLHRMKNWSSASRKFKDKTGLRDVRNGSIETHHGIIRANGNRGATWRNHFMNLRNLPKATHRRYTGNYLGQKKWSPLRRAFGGRPLWTYGFGAGLFGGATLEAIDSECGCAN